MTTQTVIDLGASAIWTAIKVAAPLLIVTMITGLIISVFQAATQINEQTLSFIPKILVMTLTMVACGSWILQTMLSFTLEIFTGIPTLGR